jgi:hypothetical protein
VPASHGDARCTWGGGLTDLLNPFLAAVAVLHCIFALLKAHKRVLNALRDGIKPTWRNVFSRIRELLYELPCAFGRVA